MAKSDSMTGMDLKHAWHNDGRRKYRTLGEQIYKLIDIVLDTPTRGLRQEIFIFGLLLTYRHSYLYIMTVIIQRRFCVMKRVMIPLLSGWFILPVGVSR